MFVLMSELKQSPKYRRNGMIPDAGSLLWPRSSQSWKVHGKDFQVEGVSGKATVVSEDSGMETEASGGSEEEVETSEGRDQEAATDPQTKARSGVLVKRSGSDRL